MGLFKKSANKDLMNLIRARDSGEEWAAIKLAELCKAGTYDVEDLSKARIVIYEAPAKRGDKQGRL